MEMKGKGKKENLYWKSLFLFLLHLPLFVSCQASCLPSPSLSCIPLFFSSCSKSQEDTDCIQLLMTLTLVCLFCQKDLLSSQFTVPLNFLIEAHVSWDVKGFSFCRGTEDSPEGHEEDRQLSQDNVLREWHDKEYENTWEGMRKRTRQTKIIFISRGILWESVQLSLLFTSSCIPCSLVPPSSRESIKVTDNKASFFSSLNTSSDSDPFFFVESLGTKRVFMPLSLSLSLPHASSLQGNELCSGFEGTQREVRETWRASSRH